MYMYVYICMAQAILSQAGCVPVCSPGRKADTDAAVSRFKLGRGPGSKADVGGAGFAFGLAAVWRKADD